MPHMNAYAVDNPYYALGSMTRIGTGVIGQLVDQCEKGVYIISFYSEASGKGNAGRCIEELQTKYSVIKFPAVINPQLEGMLLRRGFKKKREHVALMKTHVDVYTWRKIETGGRAI